MVQQLVADGLFGIGGLRAEPRQAVHDIPDQMKPIEIIRVATINGAQAIGLEREIGSLEPGKLADFQVLDRNPLDDIRNTDSIRWVVQGGRVFDGNTLVEQGPSERAGSSR